jgi:hypothetical protein
LSRHDAPRNQQGCGQRDADSTAERLNRRLYEAASG